MEAARRLTDLPGFASGLIIHHDDFPVPSFCTRINRLCKDRLCLIEFCKEKNRIVNYDENFLSLMIGVHHVNLVKRCYMFPELAEFISKD